MRGADSVIFLLVLVVAQRCGVLGSAPRSFNCTDQSFGPKYVVGPMDEFSINIIDNCHFSAGLEFDGNDENFKGTILIRGGTADFINFADMNCHGCVITVEAVRSGPPSVIKTYPISFSGDISNSGMFTVQNCHLTGTEYYHAMEIANANVNTESAVNWIGNTVVVDEATAPWSAHGMELYESDFTDATIVLEGNHLTMKTYTKEAKGFLFHEHSTFTRCQVFVARNTIRIESTQDAVQMAMSFESVFSGRTQIVIHDNIMRGDKNAIRLNFDHGWGNGDSQVAITNNNLIGADIPVSFPSALGAYIGAGGTLMHRCNKRNGIAYNILPGSHASTFQTCNPGQTCELFANCIIDHTTGISGSTPNCHCECHDSTERIKILQPNCRPGPWPPTATPTVSPVATDSATPTPSDTDSSTQSNSRSLTLPSTPSGSATPSVSATFPGTPTQTSPPTASPSSSMTPSRSNTRGPTSTRSASGTATPTTSRSPTGSDSSTGTKSRSIVASETHSIPTSTSHTVSTTVGATVTISGERSSSLSVQLSSSMSSSLAFFELLVANETITAANIESLAGSNITTAVITSPLDVHFDLRGDELDHTVTTPMTPLAASSRCLRFGVPRQGSSDFHVISTYLNAGHVELLIDGPAVGRIRFRPNATFRINEQVILNVSLRADCIATRRNSPNATITILPNPIEDVPTLPQGVKDTAEAVGTTAAIAGGAMGSPLTASQLSRSSIIASIAECEPEDEALAFGESPTGAAFSGVQAFYLGAAVMNHVVLVALFLLQLAFAAIWSRTKSVSFQHGLIVARCPSLMVFPALLLMEPTAMCAMVVILYGTPGQVALGVISLILCCCIPIATALYFRCRPFASEFLADYDSEANAVIAFMLGRAKWRDLDVADTSRVPGFTQRHRLFFEDFRETTRWFMTVEMAMCIACGIVEGIKLGAGQCDGVLIALCIAFAVYLVATVAIRPYCVPFLWWFAVVMTVVQLCGAIFMAIHMMGGVRDARIWAEWTSVINLWMLMFRAIFDLYPLFRKTRRQFAKIELAKKKASAPAYDAGRAGTHFNLSEGVLKVADDKDLIGDHTAAVQVAEARDDSDDDSLLGGPPPDDNEWGAYGETEEHPDHYHDIELDEFLHPDEDEENDGLEVSLSADSIDSLLEKELLANPMGGTTGQVVEGEQPENSAAAREDEEAIETLLRVNGFEMLEQLDEWSLCGCLAKRCAGLEKAEEVAALAHLAEFVVAHEANHGVMSVILPEEAVEGSQDASAEGTNEVNDKGDVESNKALAELLGEAAVDKNLVDEEENDGAKEMMTVSSSSGRSSDQLDEATPLEQHPDAGAFDDINEAPVPATDKESSSADDEHTETSAIPARVLNFPSESASDKLMDSLAALRTDAIAAMLLQRLRDRLQPHGAAGAKPIVPNKERRTIADAIVDDLDVVNDAENDINL